MFNMFKKKENKCCANCKWCGLNSKIYTGSRCTLWNRYTLINDIDEIHNNKGLIYDWCCKDWSKKEMKTIDSCENKDKICKSRAECMREISEQNKFDIEEEFKNICIKERETILENIHNVIENNAKRGNREIEFRLYQYMSKEFKTIGNTANGYYVCDDNTYFRDKFFGLTGIVELKKEVSSDSYVWKFVDKLDYDTAKRISIEYIHNWIKQSLKDEGFDFSFNKDNKCIIRW